MNLKIGVIASKKYSRLPVQYAPSCSVMLCFDSRGLGMK